MSLLEGARKGPFATGLGHLSLLAVEDRKLYFLNAIDLWLLYINKQILQSRTEGLTL